MSSSSRLLQWLAPHQESQADLAVIIVSWNVRAHLLENLSSLAASEGACTARCIVVDNASTDGSMEAVRETYPWVQMITNRENRGFAAATNQGIHARQARHVLLLNPDMRVEKETLARTVAYLDAHMDAAVVGGYLSGQDGIVVESVRRFPSFLSQLALVCKVPHLFPQVLDRYLWKGFDYGMERSVEVVRGSFFAIHERALQTIGALDERYFLWYEEMDYCRQAIAHKWKVMYVPSLRATDKVGQSFRQVGLYLSQRRLLCSLIAYFDKWHPRWHAAAFRIVRPLVLATAWIVERAMILLKIKEYKRAKT